LRPCNFRLLQHNRHEADLSSLLPLMDAKRTCRCGWATATRHLIDRAAGRRVGEVGEFVLALRTPIGSVKTTVGTVKTRVVRGAYYALRQTTNERCGRCGGHL